MSGKIKQIFSDHWEAFVNEVGKDRIRSTILYEVERMLSCGDFSNGYTEYHCSCGEKKYVAFTCKSRFCPSCGIAYTDRWVDNLSEKMFAVSHRHMVFTIPEELRVIFARNRELLKLLSDTAAHVVKWTISNRKKKSKIESAVVATIHTFGRDLKWNPHIHCLVAEGYLENETTWKKVDYFHFEQLRKSWQFSLLKALKKALPDTWENRKLINKLFKKNAEGFYVHAQSRMRDARSSAKYIGRYVGRPAIAESRITCYDGEKVTFWYEKNDTSERVEVTLTAKEFIKLLIRHIADKGFKMVRHYGLYSRVKKVKGAIIQTIGEKYAELKAKRRTWRYRIIKSFEIDPLRCSNCGQTMYFYDIVWPKYGSLLKIIKKKMDMAYEKEEAKVKKYFKEIGHWDGLYMPYLSA